MSENLRKVDCTMAPRGVWLVKVPRYLSELWSANEDQDVGKLVIKGDPRQGDVKLELISRPNLVANVIAENVRKPQEEQKIVSHLENAPQEHIFVFNNNPGHNMVLMKEDKTDLREDAEINSGKIAIQGKVVKRAECRPNDQKYMRMKIEQIQKSQQPRKFIQQLDRAAVKFKPVATHSEERVRAQQKKQGAKLHRADEDVVRNAIFHAFEKHQYYKLHDLQQLLQQPAGYLKGILTDIADYNTAPPHRSMWELKPEYRDYSVKNDK